MSLDMQLVSDFIANNQDINVNQQVIEQGIVFLTENAFEVQKILGAGTVGVTLLALDLSNKSQVAIKQVIFKDDYEYSLCVEAADRIQKLNSPFTVKLLKTLSSAQSKSFFFVNEFIQGDSLTTYMAKSDFASLPAQQAIQIILDILQGIMALNKEKLFHGSLNPNNILITQIQQSIKLSDFGLPLKLVGRKTHLSGKEEERNYQVIEWTVKGKAVPETDYFAAGIIFLKILKSIKTIEPSMRQKLISCTFGMNEINPKMRATPKQMYRFYTKIAGKSEALDEKTVLRKIVDQEGNQYEGQMKYDMKNGRGCLFLIDGSYFEGQFVDNKKDGEGILIFSNGRIAKQNWKNGKVIPIQAEGHVVSQELKEPIMIQNMSKNPETKKQGCTGCAIM